MSYCRRHLDDQTIQRRWLDPRLPAVRPAQVRAYLLPKRWREVQADQPGVIVFREPDSGENGPLYQWLPDDPARRDYVQAVYELLAAMAEIENRYAGDILTDILAQSTKEPLAANGPPSAVHSEPTVRR